MNKNENLIHNIVIASLTQFKQAKILARNIQKYLEPRGIHIQSGSLYDEDIQQRIESKTTDLLIALGGDGTMLQAGHLCGPYGVPILGINLGRFGFLTEIKVNQWEKTIQNLFTNEYWLEKRMMLQVEHLRNNNSLGKWNVLNEVVISRGQIVKPVHLDAYVDGRYLTTYVADGLIVATPTGSTAYALAAGGPILPPEVRNILLVPVAPHLSIDRAIVLAEGSSVTVEVQTEYQAVISNDGHDPIEVMSEDTIKVVNSKYSALFVRFQDPGYFYRNLTPHMNRNPSTGYTS